VPHELTAAGGLQDGHALPGQASWPLLAACHDLSTKRSVGSYRLPSGAPGRCTVQGQSFSTSRLGSGATCACRAPPAVVALEHAAAASAMSRRRYADLSAKPRAAAGLKCDARTCTRWSQRSTQLSLSGCSLRRHCRFGCCPECLVLASGWRGVPEREASSLQRLPRSPSMLLVPRWCLRGCDATASGFELLRCGRDGRLVNASAPVARTPMKGELRRRLRIQLQRWPPAHWVSASSASHLSIPCSPARIRW